MSKDKKKSSKKGKLSDDLLDVAAVSIKKFRKVTRQLTKLSTGQKLVGGAALLAAGLTYLAKKQSEEGKMAAAVHGEPIRAAGAEPAADQEATVTPPAAKKIRKNTRAK